ncbi:ORF6N domain-containing protein [Acetobacterium wieringae]|uniref:ORF6N domain-containing protein n=1 Tax=Acetobacterium wieringae TaxID=52694 RepID=UPI003158B148
MNALRINNHELGIKEYNRQRVVTFSDVDVVHERQRGTAKRNFNTNKKHFIKDEDYFIITRSDVGTKFVPTYGFDKKAPSGVLLTETGYLMLVKSFTDDLAWEVQRKLVKSYFRAKEEIQTAPVPATTIIPKTYHGQSVLTVRDIEALTGISKYNVNYHLSHEVAFVKGVDYIQIKGIELQKFKRENNHVSIMVNSLNLLTLTGAEKIALYSPDYSKEMAERLRIYFKTDQPKKTDGEDLQQRYTRITEAQILMEAASKIDDPFYKEYVYKNVTAMMMAGSPKTGTTKEDPAGVGFFYRLGALLASTDKKGRDDIRNKIIAELKSDGNSDGVVASANEFFILAESVLAE